ncbi:MAG: hypothetical protein IRZ28_02950 [Steroidobacteraceae bacterium]|nr:hypothetical protein [Steroidobacteraceae bacterium]
MPYARHARLVLLWVLSSAVAVAVALTTTNAAQSGDQYIPMGNDSFYHARRVLDLISDPSHLHQFDPLVHYPEGSQLIWPWGYDYFMSLLTRIGLAAHLSSDAMTVLAHIPVVAFPLTLALVLLICRQLNLTLTGTAVALLATALFGLNRGLYGVGSIDHHFAEQMLVLGALASGLAWLRKPESRVRAAGLGALLGFSQCIHNGLFVLQLPIVLTMMWTWYRGQPLPRNTPAFATALLASTVAGAAPSTAFQEGAFEFYTLSWFHVYFSACAGATCVFVSRVRFSEKMLAVLGAAVLAAIAPVAGQVLLAERFLSVSVEGAEQIGEVQSVFELISNAGIRTATAYYSLLVLLMPATLILCCLRVWRSLAAHDVFFWASSLCGLLLLATMMRMHPFGSFALYLTWIVFIEQETGRKHLSTPTVRATQALLLVAACGPAIPALFVPAVKGNDPYYALTYDMYPDLARECQANPGVALASLDDGNYIRYHTTCPVIANNFLLTPFHESKVREVRELMHTPAAELVTRAPAVRYVFVHRMSLFRRGSNGRIEFLPAGDPEQPDPRLVSDLLDNPPSALPQGFRLIREEAFERPEHVVFARMFAIEPPAVSREPQT